jgi:hypothetical protein
MPAKKSNQRFSLQRKATLSYGQILIYIVLFAGMGIVALAQSFAAPANKGGKPSGGSSGSLSLIMVDDHNVDGLPNWSDTVTFDVQTSATSSPYVTLKCSQGGTTVLTGTAGFWDGYAFPFERNMQLSSPSWTGGAADCTATLWSSDGKKTKTLAITNFHVNP